jgi:hypothetical protein
MTLAASASLHTRVVLFLCVLYEMNILDKHALIIYITWEDLFVARGTIVPGTCTVVKEGFPQNVPLLYVEGGCKFCGSKFCSPLHSVFYRRCVR